MEFLPNPFGPGLVADPPAPVEPTPVEPAPAPVEPDPVPIPVPIPPDGVRPGELLFIPETDPYTDPPRTRVQVAIIVGIHGEQAHTLALGYLDQCAAYPVASMSRG